MSNLTVLNDNFSHTPAAKVELIDENTCRVTSGTLYVNGSTATGYASGGNSRVVATIDGARAVQEHIKAEVMAITSGGKVTKLRAVDTSAPAASSSSGAASSGSVLSAIKNRGC